MTESADLSRPARLWVLFDGSSGSQAALLQALPLVQAGGLELRALYIEDPMLVSCAGLSPAREIGAVSGRPRTQTQAGHRNAQAVRRRRAQACLDHLLGKQSRPLQLESRLGSPLSVIRSLINDQDWIVAGRSGYAGWQPARFGSLTRSLIGGLRSALMVGSPSGLSYPGPWLLFLDGSASVDQMLARALALAESLGSELKVVSESEFKLALTGPATQIPAPWIKQRIGSGLALQKLIHDHRAAGLIASPDSALIRVGLAAGWLDRIDRPLMVLPD